LRVRERQREVFALDLAVELQLHTDHLAVGIKQKGGGAFRLLDSAALNNFGEIPV